MESTDALAAFSALGQQARLGVLRHLIQAGPDGLAAGEIAARLGCPPSTLSAHLAVLTRAGLARSRRESRSILYAADLGTIRDLVAFLVQDCCGGNARACAPLLDQIAEAVP